MLYKLFICRIILFLFHYFQVDYTFHDSTMSNLSSGKGSGKESSSLKIVEPAGMYCDYITMGGTLGLYSLSSGWSLKTVAAAETSVQVVNFIIIFLSTPLFKHLVFVLIFILLQVVYN